MQGSSFNPTKRRKISEQREAYPFKVHLKINKLQFNNCAFPVLLKVSWVENSVALETRTKNALVGKVGFSKKLKRVVQFSNRSDPLCFLSIAQKVGHGYVHVGFANINISPCFEFFGQDVKISNKLDMVVDREGWLEVSAAVKPHKPGQQEFGSTTFSSKIFNLFPNIHLNACQKLAAFEDIYLSVLEEYEHIFSLDSILEHSDHTDCLELDPNTTGLDPSELADLQSLLLGLDLFQEKKNPNKWKIAPYSFDLAAFKRVILHYQEQRGQIETSRCSTDCTTNSAWTTTTGASSQSSNTYNIQLMGTYEQQNDQMFLSSLDCSESNRMCYE